MERNQSNGKKAKTPQGSAKGQPRRASNASVSAPPDGVAVSPEERRRLIAEAAYYRAQQRGFCGGDPIQDWLEAEAEVTLKLARALPPRERRPAVKAER
jgi:hypothetical protein